MPDLIRHPVPSWIPAFAGMTTLMYLVAGVIIGHTINVFQGGKIHACLYCYGFINFFSLLNKKY